MQTLDTVRLPFFYAAVALMAAVVLIEIGAGVLLNNAFSGAGSVATELNSTLDSAPSSVPMVAELREALGDLDSDDIDDVSEDVSNVPGLGIPYLVAVDGVLLFTLLIILAGLILPPQAVARSQGCVTCGVSCLSLLGLIGMLVVALGSLLLMVALLLAVPFGTIAYMIIYGFFNTGAAAGVLSVIMILKIACLVCLVLAQQRFLKNLSLMLLMASSLLMTLVVSLLHSLVPGFLVSITDAVGALIVGICGVIWLVVLLLGTLPGVLSALNLKGLRLS